jgi:acetylornithine deacetylase
MDKISVQEAVELLREMISIPSHSRDEKAVADMIEKWLVAHGATPQRIGNNIILQGEREAGRPTILLNSHIDTVKPAAGYTIDPYTPTLEGDTLYGLGSNDAGASVVSLLCAYSQLTQESQPYNLIYACTAEEEVSGKNGIELILPTLGDIDLAIVGEPTQMQMAVAEKGLMVLDCTAKGKSGHAARNEGINAIYEAMKDIEWFRTYTFPRVSEYLGAVKMSVTMIEAGTQHNVVPDTCKYVVDVRVNEKYSNSELLELIKGEVKSEVKERSTRLNSSAIDSRHAIVQRGESLGLSCFGSPTMSDQALMPFTSIKIGPGDSARSHTANEYIRLTEIAQGVDTYVTLLHQLKL